MRIQPIDSIRSDFVKPPVLKSRLKRLFDRPFNSVLRISMAEKPAAGAEKDGGGAAAVADFEPTSVCLDKMVQNFIEDNNEKNSSAAAAKCARNRCNCFNGNSNDSSDDELDFFLDSVSANSSFTDPFDTLKSLIPCASMAERNLLAETSKIVEKNNKISKRKDSLRKIVTDALIALGYNASVCKSKWEKSSIPAGEYEYIDVILEGERLLIDIDFRSELEIVRSTSGYKAVLQCLPLIFVGKPDRLLQIVTIASEAARQSLKKKGMHIAPWRKPDYMRSKWFGPHTRITRPELTNLPEDGTVDESKEEARPESSPHDQEVLDCEVGEMDLIFGEDMTYTEGPKSPARDITRPPVMTWQLPSLKPKSVQRGKKAVVTELASLIKERL